MAEVPDGSLNPHAPEYILISTPPPPPPPYVLLPPPPFLPAMIPLHPFPPSMLPPYPFPPAMLPPYPFPPAMIPPPHPPTVNSPPQENVRPSRAIRPRRRQIPPRLGGLENKTTVMIKSIPYHYKRDMLMQFLDQYCFLEDQIARNSNGENIHVFAYDFLHLPMDFRKRRNFGYAFVNFTDQRTLWEFFRSFNDKLKVFSGSVKSVEIVTADIQGRNALVNRYKDSRFPCESDRYLPVCFNPPRDGSGESVQMITVGQYNQIDST